MKRMSGFTIVEVTVVVIVLGILVGIVLTSYAKIQADSRDATRQGNITALADALEKYYAKNGEYPSIQSIVSDNPSNTGSAVATKLNMNASDLKMPQAASSVTNSLIATATPTNDTISYVSTDSSTSCQSSTTGGCIQFTLKYTKENGGLTTVNSRHG
jgi:Tfp pilus assembly protein PilE